MKRANNININTGKYWDGIYADKEKREQYATQGTSVAPVKVGIEFIKPTSRFRRATDEVQDGQRVVDMGCGVGAFTTLLHGIKPNCEIWGTDISAKAMHDNTMERPQIRYLHQTIGKQDLLPNDYFDVVFSGETLEHLDDPNDLFKDAHRVLKPNGKFVLTTPNKDWITSPEHTWMFDHDDVKRLYEDNGFGRVRFVYLPGDEATLVIMAIGFKK